ncbi:GNAT family N-acetyltransferase [Vibrio cionasavignyae]|uniref:GNAT family N-acetyltransferase n=1 Tax=Vibrio cionasavignyae TaxID=2910252 RepID=UPI003D14B708
MDLNTSVVHVDIRQGVHYILFKTLFDEYSSKLSAEIDPNTVKNLFELPYFHGFLCFFENQPAGFAVCFESYSTYRAKKVINIHDFMVSDNFRGQGVGKVLLHGIERYCQECGVLKITLEVDDENTVAKRLYRSCDFKDYQVEQKGLQHWQKYLR